MKQEIELFLGDITTLKVDAIVNAANQTLLGGGGVDGAIHKAAGPQLKEYCRKLNGCNVGEAKLSPGFNLPSRYVIHTVGPTYFSTQENKAGLLADCYIHSIELAVEHGLYTIAFPAISTGVYSYPVREATQIAVRTVRRSLFVHSRMRKVIFCCFDQNTFDVYKQELNL